MGQIANLLYSQGYPGFESPSLRQRTSGHYKFPLYQWISHEFSENCATAHVAEAHVDHPHSPNSVKSLFWLFWWIRFSLFDRIFTRKFFVWGEDVLICSHTSYWYCSSKSTNPYTNIREFREMDLFFHILLTVFYQQRAWTTKLLIDF